MARSYKKTPVVKDRRRAGSARYWKNQANRRIRRLSKQGKFDHRGTAYKKEYEQWEIHDYQFYWSKQDALNRYRNSVWYDHTNQCFRKTYDEYHTEEQFVKKCWEKEYRRK